MSEFALDLLIITTYVHCVIRVFITLTNTIISPLDTHKSATVIINFQWTYT